MKKPIFITEDFLLESNSARRLYRNFAANMPIIDYHCHLSPRQIAVDQRWENLTQIWLDGDHYKWRAMRTNGVAEKYCTGGAPDREKFQKWAETMPFLLRNPLFHWSHLELSRYFGISDRLLNPDTAGKIWDECNERLAEPEMSARGLIRRSSVVLICTTDDPVDSLEYHLAIAKDRTFKTRVLPTWRPDRGIAIDSPAVFNAWLDKLSSASDIDISNFNDYILALRKRHDFFHKCGCRLSDHGLDTIYAEDCSEADLRRIFAAVRKGKKVSAGDALKFKSAMLHEFAVMDHEKNWTQQFHLGVLRNANERLFRKYGPDAGCDSIGDFEIARPLARFLSRLDAEGKLTRTILYNINPRDSALMATMAGNFQDGSVAGKIQYGSGWWFLDQKDGMERQIEDLSQMGLLGRFVGMLTDSRSFLSYARHEYFRRILCNILGSDISRGLLPADLNLIGKTVRDICYNNAADYFGFGLPARSG